MYSILTTPKLDIHPSVPLAVIGSLIPQPGCAKLTQFLGRTMGHSSYADRRPHNYPTSHTSRSPRSSFGSAPHWSFSARLPPDTKQLPKVGTNARQAVNDDGLFSPESACEKRTLSSNSVASEASTAVFLDQSNSHCRHTRLNSVLWRILLIELPIASLSALLFGLIFGLKVQTEPSLFPLDGDSDIGGQHALILVNLSATRLGIVPNCMSLLAPCLGSLIMGLWRLCTARSLQEATHMAETQGKRPELPDIDDFRYVVGLILASIGELLRYFIHSAKRRFAVPSVLHKAAAMFIVSLVLAGGVLVATTWLQIVIQPINFDAISVNRSPTSAYGRGLSAMCLDFNRTANQGFPCTYDLIAPDTELSSIAMAQNEIYNLQNNISRSSEIRMVAMPRLTHGDLAVLTPQMESLPNNVDYRASAIGVSTQCRPLTVHCNMQDAGPGGQYTQFNCTGAFWGLLGKPPNVTTVTNSKAEDPDLPPMAFKPLQSLQYAFFTDPGLSISYNTEGRNISTGDFAVNASTLPDSALINPIFVAVAGRISTQDTSATSDLSADPNMFANGFSWIDVTLNCSYTTYEVNYTWANGAIHNATISPSLNGTLAEMYHGAQSFASVDGGDPVLQDNLRRAAHQNSSEAFASQWANLYSVDVLSTIGAYSTPRTNIQEQTRTSMLVTQVPIVPLALLFAFSLAYIPLGIWLGIVAHRAASSSPDIWALATGLSLPAIVAAAFRAPPTGEDDAKVHADITKDDDESSDTMTKAANESRIERVRTAGSSEKGWPFTITTDTRPGLGV